MPVNAPLKPEPEWKQDRDGSYYKNNFSGANVPRAYALGFEEGAYALAEQLLTLLQAGQKQQLAQELLMYGSGAMRPALKWKSEAPRK